jgi:site-specific DNA-methyltransferase (adenine-specific)
VIIYLVKDSSSIKTFAQPFLPYDDEYIAKKYSNISEDGRRYMLDNLTAPGAGSRGHPRYELLGITRYWRYGRERMDSLVAEGRVVQPSPGAVPRYKRYLDEVRGIAIGDCWTDINAINSQADERLGYPTQKPVALLERIVAASSSEGDLVLDPFCGCGTAIEAAQKLNRRWIGIDITYLAVHVIEERLNKVFGPSIAKSYKVLGSPKDADDAKSLAARDWLEFQKWAVFKLGGLPKNRPGADGGIDGVIRYHRVGIEQPNRAMVSVKGGANVGVDSVHKLKSVMVREKAEVGILVCLERPTSAMNREALSEGEVGPRSRRVARIQIVPVEKLFLDHPVELPGVIDPPELVRNPPPTPPKRSKKYVEGQGELLLPILGEAAGATYDVKERPNRSIRKVEIEVMRPTRPTRSRS